jgi:hypothetical protein
MGYTFQADLAPGVDHYAVNVLSRDYEWISNRFAGKNHEMNVPSEDVPLRIEATNALIIEARSHISTLR